MNEVDTENQDTFSKPKSFDWLAPYQFQKGQSGNPGGRPKGRSLKGFATDYLMSLNDEEKLAFLATLPPEIVWRMAEGNPHTTEDKKVSISVPRPILGGLSQAESKLIEDEAMDALADAPPEAPQAPVSHEEA